MNDTSNLENQKGKDELFERQWHLLIWIITKSDALEYFSRKTEQLILASKSYSKMDKLES